MSRKHSLQSIIKIIDLLAEHKEVYQSQMPKETNLSYKTIIKTLKQIEGKLVNHRTEPSKYGGKNKKIYSITFIGLCFYLAYSEKEVTVEEARTKLKQIINRFPDMLLFFKKWQLFSEPALQEKMLNLFIKNLQASLTQYDKQINLCIELLPKEKLEEAFQEADRDFLKNVDRLTLVGALHLPDTKKRVKLIYSKDQELKNYVNSEVTKTEKELKQIEEIKSFSMSY